MAGRSATVGGRIRRTFSSLGVPDMRWYVAGQTVSMTGTWMQVVAQSWLVLELTGSGTVLGLVVAAQFLPILLAGPYGGLLADRWDKRHLLMATQTASSVLALLLGLLVLLDLVQMWNVVVLAVAVGLVNAVDNPARQTFVTEIVGTDLLANAVGLNGVLVSVTRAVGSAVAGVTIATVGTGPCFLANAVSFLAFLAVLALMRPGRLHPVPPAAAGRGQIVDGLRYVMTQPGLWVPLAMMALIGTLAYELQVVLPVLARDQAADDPRVLGYLTGAMGAGAVVGGLVIAAFGRAGLIPLIAGSAGFAGTMLLAALSVPLPLEVVALALVGAFGTVFLATGNTTLQLVSPPTMRGRVMALWSVTFLGSTPVGGPIVGAVAEHLGPRAGLALGALACVAATVVGLTALPRTPQAQRLTPRYGEKR